MSTQNHSDNWHEGDEVVVYIKSQNGKATLGQAYQVVAVGSNFIEFENDYGEEFEIRTDYCDEDVTE